MIFKIISISHGWFDIELNRQFTLVNSDFLGCDAPALLLDALGSLLDGSASVRWLCWQNEPGAYILRLERSLDRLIWEVYGADTDSTELDHSGVGLSGHVTECVYRLEEDINKSALAVEAEFSLYEKGNGRKIYLIHWGDFPHREYKRLHTLLHGNGFDGTVPEGSMNGYQKKFFRYIADIQQTAVQSVLAGRQEQDEAEDLLYDATYSVITDIMTMIDGYSGFCRGKMDIINQDTGVGIKDNPFIELHDAVCGYIKYEK